ncbi:MAG TPA: cytochrome c biogenesis protein CcsA, partial [Actinomycetota bacterium]|nr:cytochrome c biogenesis protein CcsA [Actinomycetota bacterium]
MTEALVGRVALGVALIVAVYGALAAWRGGRAGDRRLVESARTSAYALVALVAIAVGAMLVAILRGDYAIRYVAENSSQATPTFFQVLSLWSADEGSLLLWNLVLAGYVAATAAAFRRRRPASFPTALAILFSVSAWTLILVNGPTAPFEQLQPAPVDGAGPLPLLRNHPLMAVHPPLLYLGFIGFTVPFAFAIAGLLRSDPADAWIRVARRWTLVPWLFLTMGLLLGALWSYGVLGWGGYWAWDPVENVALLPWLTATALLHSMRLQERRGLLQTWNLGLAVVTFAFTLFGTFLTRGAVLESV